jgi:pimeloyl-ACP methyl ester carboxylesterase
MQMSQRGPRAKLVEVPGVGHAPMLMDAAQVTSVREFLLG